MERLGAVIRRLRLARAMSQRELAERASVERTYISQLETGSAQNPSISVLHNLAGGLGIGLEDLLRESGLIPTPEPLPPLLSTALGAFRRLPRRDQELIAAGFRAEVEWAAGMAAGGYRRVAEDNGEG